MWLQLLWPFGPSALRQVEGGMLKLLAAPAVGAGGYFVLARGFSGARAAVARFEVGAWKI